LNAKVLQGSVPTRLRFKAW